MRHLIPAAALALAGAFAAALAGCVVPDRPKGIFEPESVPPPPSEATLKSSRAPEASPETPAKNEPRAPLQRPGAAR